MNNYQAFLRLAASVRFAPAAALLVFLVGGAAQAQVTAYSPNGTAAQLGTGAVTTATYTTGDGQLYVPTPYSVAAGSNTVTFSATGGDKFEAFTNVPAPGTTNIPLDFAYGTHLLDTFDAESPTTATPDGSPTGPLRIDFGSGVSAFGLSVQDGHPDYEQFSFTVYSGTTVLSQSPFTTLLYDNTGGQSPGKSVFLGAQDAGGPLITSVLISSTSLAPGQNGVYTDTGYSNDIFFGPVSVQNAPVPEASITVSFGLLLALGLAGACVSARKKQAATQ